MRPTILVEVEFTGVNTDCLANTELDQIPTNGTMHIWAGSTVNTATLEVPQFAHRPAVTALIRLRTNGIPNMSDDPPFVIAAKSGDRPKVVLGGTTGTVHMTVIFTPTG